MVVLRRRMIFSYESRELRERDTSRSGLVVTQRDKRSPLPLSRYIEEVTGGPAPGFLEHRMA